MWGWMELCIGHPVTEGSAGKNPLACCSLGRPREGIFGLQKRRGEKSTQPISAPSLAAPAKTLKIEGIRIKGTASVVQTSGADFECLSPSSRTHRTCQVKAKNTKRPSGASNDRDSNPTDHMSLQRSSPMCLWFLKSNGLSR